MNVQNRKPPRRPPVEFHKLYDELDDIKEIYYSLYGAKGWKNSEFAIKRWDSSSYTHTWCDECGFMYESGMLYLWSNCWNQGHNPTRLNKRRSNS